MTRSRNAFRTTHSYKGRSNDGCDETPDAPPARSAARRARGDPAAVHRHRQEDRFWQQTLSALARHFDHAAEVDIHVVCVNKRRRWSRWRNVWHSAAIGSALYTLGAPRRAVKRLHVRRDRASAGR